MSGLWIGCPDREIQLTHVAANSRRDFRVTPGRIVPLRGGVAISGSVLHHTLEEGVAIY